MRHKGGAKTWVGLNAQNEDVPFDDPNAVAWFNTYTSQKLPCKPSESVRYGPPTAKAPADVCAASTGARRRKTKGKKSKKSTRRRSTRRS